MENTLLKNNLPYKINSTTFDDAKDNENAVRIFRDLSTDLYTDIFLNNNVQLANFLDYTFHVLYSEIIKNTNMNIILFNSTKNDNIKPLCGPERVYLVFKGGTLMNKFYFDYFNDLKNNFGDVKSIDVSEKFEGIPLRSFSFDLESGQNVGNNIDSFENFFENILIKKFSVSDTDYSLYIYAATEERYLVLYKFIIRLLARGFDKMTSEFDDYFNNAKDENNSVNLPNSIQDNTSNATDKGDYVTLDILNKLRDVIYDNNIVDNMKTISPHEILDNIKIDEVSLEQKINDFINLDFSDETRLFLLYDAIELLHLLIYIKSINNIYLTNVNINDIRNILIRKIDLLIKKKMSNLKNDQFYTFTKINELKKKLLKKYQDIQNTQTYFKPKIEKYFHPSEYAPTINIYQLKNNNNYTENSFEIISRQSSINLSNNDEINNQKVSEINSIKIHYTTFNTLIRKIRYLGSVVTDFDLMRSKFNIELENGFVKKNDDDISLKIPAEFVDVSVPRYTDSSRISYFRNIKHNNFTPHLLEIITKNNRNVIIYSYTPKEIMLDLQFVLTNQNTLEPWIDKKYEKRIIRLVVFILISAHIDTIIKKKKIYYEKIFHFFKLCFEIFKFTEPTEQNKKYPYDQLSYFILNNNNLPKQDIIKYLQIFNENAGLWIKQKTILPTIHFKNFEINDLLINIITWSFLYYSSDVDLLEITNIISKQFLQIPQYNMQTIDVCRIKYKKFIRIIYDYGLKLLYIFQTLDKNVFLIGGKTNNLNQKLGNKYKIIKLNKYL